MILELINRLGRLSLATLLFIQEGVSVFAGQKGMRIEIEISTVFNSSVEITGCPIC